MATVFGLILLGVAGLFFVLMVLAGLMFGAALLLAPIAALFGITKTVKNLGDSS